MVNKPETMGWWGKKIHYTLVHYMEMMPNLFLTMKAELRQQKTIF